MLALIFSMSPLQVAAGSLAVFLVPVFVLIGVRWLLSRERDKPSLDLDEPERDYYRPIL